ncbi:MAG: type IV secretion system DNA-binding domain-containing protein [Campylobacterales bacterium]|nr:type IV secretion system DNA-binding domain-containing protein [Campylobacterales bacterium]
MREEQYSIYEKYNLLKNSMVLSAPLIISNLLISITGGIVSTLVIVNSFEKSLPLSYDYVKLYTRAMFTLASSINVNGSEVLAIDILRQLEPKMSDMYLYLSFYFMIGFVASGMVAWYIIKKISDEHSNQKLKDTHLRGTTILSQKEYSIISKKIDGYSLAKDTVLSREHDTKHFMIMGATGSGKTNLIIRSIHAQASYPKNIEVGAKFIIHDLKPDYIQKIYNPDTDLIYNVSDQRSIYFNFFNYLYDANGNLDEKALINICHTIIPDSNSKDPIWDVLARNVLESILTYCMLTENRSLTFVNDMIQKSPSDLINIFNSVEGCNKGVQALTGGENTVGSVMVTLAANARYFEGLNEKCHSHKESFIIQKWLNDGKVSKLFLINDVANKDFNAPKIAVFVNTLIKEIYAMRENPNRRIYLYLDEFGTMSKIPAIPEATVVARSFGLSIILSTQEFARIDEIYGQNLRKSMLNSLTNKIIMRQTDPEMAKYFSDMIGEKEIEQSSSGASIGIQAMKNGVNFNKSVKKEFTVMPSEIMELRDFEFFVKQPDVKWGKIQCSYMPEVDGKSLNNPALVLCKNIGIILPPKKELREIFG